MKRPDPIRELRTVSKAAAGLADLIERLREVPVPELSRFLGKGKEWIRSNFKIIKHGPKDHRVRWVDVEAHQQRRTLVRNGGTP